MSSVEALREFIKQRLTAAAEEIFTVFEQTIVQYQEEIDRQRRLLQINWKPQVKLHRTDNPQQHIGSHKTSSSLEKEEHETPHIKEEEETVEVTVSDGEIFTVFEEPSVQYEMETDGQHRHRAELPQHQDCREEQIFKQETNYCLDQGEEEPPQIKEEPEKPGLLQIKEEKETPQIKEEPEEPRLLQIKENQEEPEPPQIEEHNELSTSQEVEQLSLKCESIEEQSCLSEPEKVPDTNQRLFHDPEVNDVKKNNDLESKTNAKPKKISRFHSDREDNFPVSEKQAECEKLLKEETCGEVARKKRKICQNLETVNHKKKLCEICGKSFNQKNDLLAHMRTHAGQKLYSCETCGKCFSQSILRSHMKIHTNEKRCSCEACGKTFRYQSELSVHMRTHTGEKPYPCQTCGRSFSQRYYLLTHIRMHTGEKPFGCETCDKRFTNRTSLLRHMKSHKEIKS